MSNETSDQIPTGRDLEDRKASLATFIEQTKLLESLASAFVIAPPAVQAFLALQIDWRIIVAEILFIVSVLSSYFVLGTIAGSQREGQHDVYRTGTRVTGGIQFFAYVIGLGLFAWWVLSNPAPPPVVPQP